ncbi:MAG: plasmid stabilization protein [Gemmatimonadaceae bacterium]|nr:plasmid stabilization protein [Gemmatimonadaceae bacterium]
MASITIRNLDDTTKRKLRLRAAAHGRSMEEEVREILRTTLSRERDTGSLTDDIHRRFAALGGLDLQLPEREALRAPPDLG